MGRRGLALVVRVWVGLGMIGAGGGAASAEGRHDDAELRNRSCDSSGSYMFPEDNERVPRDARFYAAGRDLDPLILDDTVRITGAWDASLGYTVFVPPPLAPGRHTIALPGVTPHSFVVRDGLGAAPPPPSELAVSLLLDEDSIGDGLHEIAHLALDAQLPPDTVFVRISFPGHAGEFVTPRDQLTICRTYVPLPAGEVDVAVRVIDQSGHTSAPAMVRVRAEPTVTIPGWTHHYRCGLGATMGFLFMFLFVVPVFVVCVLIALVRRLHRGTTGEPPVAVSNLVADALARSARGRDGVMIVVAIAVLGLAWALFHDWWAGALGGIWLAVRFGDYVVATRALAILAAPRSVAELYGTNLVVRVEGKLSAVLLSRGAIRRAKQAAVPTAKAT